MPDESERPTEADLRIIALQQAHQYSEPASECVKRAERYLAFLKGEASIPATDNG
jgi:hypothetical protein